MSWRRRSRRLAACDARSRREIVNYPRRPARLGHAFSLRVGWGDLFEEQGVVQETPGQAWLAMARDVGAAVLGERDRAGDRGLRSRSGKGRLAEHDPCVASATPPLPVAAIRKPAHVRMNLPCDHTRPEANPAEARSRRSL